jgi:periplasmic divalent cation tolerance protein
MTNQDAPVLIYTTWPDAETAARAAAALIKQRLAACANILAAATAIYEWQGELQHDSEHPMLIKTTVRCVDEVARIIKDCHPYDVPAFAVIEIAGGDPAFLAWLADQVSPSAKKAGGMRDDLSNAPMRPAQSNSEAEDGK